MAGRRWRRLTTVRARTTAAASLAFAAALLLASLSLLLMLHRSLVNHLDELAELHAEDIVALARDGQLPAVLPPVGEEGDVTQVVADTGRVLAATAGRPRDRPIVVFRPPGSEPTSRTVHDAPFAGTGRDYRVLALRTRTPQGPVTVYVASALTPVDETIALLRGSLAAGGSVLLVLVAVTTWAMVGRALRPVGAISTEVADISEHSLGRRVPVPSTDDEIGRLAGTMNTMLDRLQAAAERQRRFVADASHELQTPLASARTDLEVALAHPERTDWPETGRDLLTANRDMERLVRDLLFLARADAAAPRPPATPVDLDDVVLAEAAQLRTGGRVRVDTSAVSASAVDGRRSELARAVRNVLDNAERHASSRVAIQLCGEQGQAVLVIEDDGPGIPTGDRHRIFDRFTRLAADRSRASGGTGLGLAIAKEIVDSHGGTITVADSPRGARFVIRLPAL